MRFCAFCLALFAASVTASADKIMFQSGRIMVGQVIQKDDQHVVIRLDHGITTIPTSMVQSIEITPPPVLEKPKASGVAERARSRIPTWDTVTAALAKQKWATNLMPIPATVVDKGQMRYVPYKSYRCGEDYEVNIYGDPDAPAAVEIGVYRSLLKDEAAKTNCIEFIASVMGDQTDAQILRSLKRTQDLIVRNDLTIEITPQTAEDAYGGWWVSFYSVKALDAARATPKEIKEITVAKSSVAGSSATQPADVDPYEWHQSDISRARPAQAGSVSGGQVYVRGYYRMSRGAPKPATDGRFKTGQCRGGAYTSWGSLMPKSS